VAANDAGLHYKNFCDKMKRHEISKWDYKEYNPKLTNPKNQKNEIPKKQIKIP